MKITEKEIVLSKHEGNEGGYLTDAMIHYLDKNYKLCEINLPEFFEAFKGLLTEEQKTDLENAL